MIKVNELRGYKSLRAFNAFHALMLGLKMLPAYMLETYEAFFDRIQAMPEPDQRLIVLEAALFVKLEEEEVGAIISFCSDPNGVPYSSENLKSLAPDKILQLIVEVCIEILKIKIDFVSESEKKNSKIAR